MKTGFFTLQESFSGDTSSFIKKLDSIEENLSVPLTDNETTVASVSVASFLLGFCGELAMYFHRKYGYAIGILREGNELIHAFNVIDMGGNRYFLDARGITNEEHLFLAPFQLCDGSISIAKDIESAIDLVPEGEWFFPEDEISDAMIAWLIHSFSPFYDASSLPSQAQSSLAFSIKKAQDRAAEEALQTGSVTKTKDEYYSRD